MTVDPYEILGQLQIAMAFRTATMWTARWRDYLFTASLVLSAALFTASFAPSFTS